MSGINGQSANVPQRGTGKIHPPQTGPLGKLKETPGSGNVQGSGNAAGRDTRQLSGKVPAEPGHPGSVTDAVIAAFQRGYTPPAVPDDNDQGRTPDGGIVGGEAYVEQKSPLRATVQVGAKSAAVCLGVDPGTFFCGGQAKLLADLKRTYPGMQTGFIHVPPDQQSGGVAPQLATRAENHAMMAQVLGKTVRGLAGDAGDKSILLTGYGPFEEVQDNPTQAFLQNRDGSPNKGNLDRVMTQAFGPGSAAKSVPLRGEDDSIVGYRYTVGNRQIALLEGCMQLGPSHQAAVCGTYFPDMGPVARQFDRVFDQAVLANQGRTPDAVISMGVDSTQRELKTGQKPSFKIETQAQGFYQEAPDPNFSPVPVANHDLARIWLRG